MSLARLAGEAGRSQVPLEDRPGIESTGGQTTEERFEVLAKYIPTETITLFVAIVSAMHAIAELEPDVTLDPWLAYWAFAILTPLIVLALAYASYREAARDPAAAQPTPPFRWPLFRMGAAGVAFLVWALAVPGLLERPVWQIVAGVGALFVSTVLSIVERIVGPS